MLDKKIWWLASFPKSGNTWVRMFISAYTQGRMDINHCPSSTSDIHRVHYQAVSPLPLSDLKPSELAIIRPAALLTAATMWPIKPVLMKTHVCNCLFGGMSQIPPTLTEGAIYIVRDPRDVAISLAEHMAVSIDTAILWMSQKDWFLKDGGGQHQFVGDWSTHVKSWTEGTPFNVLIIKYEDMLDRTKEVFGKLLEFQNLPREDVRLDTAIEMCSFENLKEQEEASGFRECSHEGHVFFKRGKAGGWKETLTKEQVRRIEYDHKETMQRMGYL